MATLTAAEAIVRLKQTEQRTHTLVNDPDNVGHYTTDTNPPKQVETYPHFMARIQNEADGVVALATEQAQHSEASAQRSEAAAGHADAMMPVITATGNTQVTRVQNEGNTQHNRVLTEGNLQTARVVTEGDRQTARVALEGNAQYQRAREEANRAEHAASAIPGFADNTQAFFGFNVLPDGRLLLTISEDGDRLVASDFEVWAILPASSRFYLDDGRLMLDLPFQQSATIGGI